MPFIADQAAKAQTLRDRKLGQRESRCAGRNSTTAHAGVHIDDHTERHLCAEPMPRKERRQSRSLSTPTIMSVTRASLDKAFDRGRACDLIGQQDALRLRSWPGLPLRPAWRR